MNYQLQTTSIVRQRGQLTIPDSIRGKVNWVAPGSVVTLAQTKADEIIIRPHTSSQTKINWEKLWLDIERVRSYKGKGGGNLAAFIAKDRESRK
ncbi:MAG: AbrB/MazE/SpoVT family DNA-binding domain-containing protein [Candidatus Chisholmbacteria bacterium]|nr:AbrB/MazE/SpoVT family DNA-binding domain-containing protein [Candidatus Chisholmbacteria bacterium]